MEINFESAARSRRVDAVSLPPPFGPIIPQRYRSRETRRRDCVRNGEAMSRSGDDQAAE
jgi:hypothetical protein